MSGCAKIRYATRRAAKLAARQHKHASSRLTAYRCDECIGFWHLTSQDTRTKTFFRRLQRQET